MQLRLRESNGRQLRLRGSDSLHSIWLGAKARAHCVRVDAAEDSEISTGENHEISTFDCSNDGTDERDDDLVQ